MDGYSYRTRKENSQSQNMREHRSFHEVVFGWRLKDAAAGNYKWLFLDLVQVGHSLSQVMSTSLWTLMGTPSIGL
jgi:hypothetical protein